MNITQTNVSTS